MKLLALLSGGIDSPVACYLMLKCGFKIEYIHFALGKKSIEKTKALVSKLKDFGGGARFFIVPHSALIQLIREIEFDERYTCVFCKRAMLRIAELLAEKLECKALLTGDNLGQVASQTVPNIFVEDSAVRIPILRPLICLDKEEITEIAKKVGTYEISITRDEGCSAVPSKPITRARIERVIDIDVGAIVAKLKEISV
jgi:thiamine biosynthesis protein ThiI